MPDGRQGRAWGYFALLTVLTAAILGAGYFWLRAEVRDEALSRHQRQINNQLNLWQEQFYDAKWDSLADTSDDVLHLGSYDEAQLLADTLVWYVYPDGRAFIEGAAVIGPDGKPRPSKIAAVINDAGEPLAPERLAELKKSMPWLDNPWLPSYAFVIDAFSKEPEREFFLSPLIEAPGRLVYVMASPWRDEQGGLKGAVIQQQAIGQFVRNIITPGAKAINLWIMDRRGTVGEATSPLARASARAFVDSGALARATAQGDQAAEDGQYGARGSLVQNLPQGPARLNWRTMEGSFVLAVVESQASLGSVGRSTLDKFGAIALLCLLLLAGVGGAYTLRAVRREGRTVEKDTLRRYAGTVSHRVRNDLMVVQGYLELQASQASPDQTQQQRLAALGRAVDDIEHTVKELERLSRGEAELEYEGQLAKDSLYRLHADQGKGGKV